MSQDLLLERISFLTSLAAYFQSEDEGWKACMDKAFVQNPWFTPDNIKAALDAITNKFLQKDLLLQWIEKYPKLKQNPDNSHITVGLVMAGNIPLVGFHDFLCLFLAGFNIRIKLSSKDTVLWQHILAKIQTDFSQHTAKLEVAEMLKGCSVYIATGSNNTAQYFEAYFGKYPHIIRRNRTSVAVLTGTESPAELKALQQDCSAYFGMGCRNVSHIFVPEDYDFKPLIQLFDEDDQLKLHTKYRNNYDYYLAIYLLNKVKYHQGNNVLLVESSTYFAPIATIHYSFYKAESLASLISSLENDDDIQALITNVTTIQTSKMAALGNSQTPGLTDYADGVDTMAFLEEIGRK